MDAGTVALAILMPLFFFVGTILLYIQDTHERFFPLFSNVETAKWLLLITGSVILVGYWIGLYYLNVELGRI